MLVEKRNPRKFTDLFMLLLLYIIAYGLQEHCRIT
jgi:hypothetical protein